MTSVALSSEIERLAALRRYNVLDSEAEEPFDRVTSMLRKVLGVPMAAVTLVDRDRQWFKSHSGLEFTETARDIAFCEHTIRTQKPLIVQDTGKDLRFRDNPLVLGSPFIASYAGVPLVTPDGFNIGALCVLDRVPRSFTTTQIDLLRGFGEIVINELELRQIAMRDQLTDALTRRAFVVEATRQIGRRDRFQRPSALVLFDLDHFKAINDRFGHPGGDEVLSRVAAYCASTIRAEDSFARIGGEEFALLLPETDALTAMQIAERLRTALASLTFGIDPTLAVTASFGIAPLAHDIADAEAWLAAVDTALYAAKHAGRNCCRQTRTLYALP